MKLSLFGRWSMALFASMALGLGMTACGGGTIGYMWVLGQQYNQITGFKIDDYSGNLTEVPGAPFSSNGSVPVSLVIKSGRFLYVVNQGIGGGPEIVGPPTNPTPIPGFVKPTGASVALFAVGGDGTLTYQESYQTQGFVSQWAQMDAGSTYLYVLDKYSPYASAADCMANPAALTCFGAVTVFQADPTTGRLTLITNAQTKTTAGQNHLTFDVGNSPFIMKSLGGCLYTVNGGDETISPLAIGVAGQLINVPHFIPQAANLNLTSINGAGSYIFLTDAGSNQILGYQSGGTCNLTALNGGGITPNTVNTSNPAYSFLDARTQYLYVLNQSTTNTTPNTPNSSISAFYINPSNQELQEIVPGGTFSVGSGPVCMVEDPSSQYMYISNHNDGTITGKAFQATTGELSQLKRGSTFPAVGKSGCLAVSGSID
jgi:6-phosphogluconolactonase (cycloisomerase 2 family)